MSTHLEVAVLGPLEVRVDGAAVAVGGRARALLAALALHRSDTLTADRLLQLVWPDRPPDGGRNALQALVSRTRRALGPAGEVVATTDRGYRLELPQVALDAGRLEAAVAAARREAAHDRDPAPLQAALAAWRGDPFVEVADDPEAVAAATRLRELRLDGVELHAEAVLANGGGAELIPDLRGLAAEHPEREGLHRALAVALYLAGRQTDALATIDALVARLAEELGLDPDPRTDELRTALLRHDRDGAVRSLGVDVAAGAGPPDVGREAPGSRAGPRPLPRPRTSFVGRDVELQELAGLLPATRLVTLVGPGGTGKTRLAVEAAAALDPAPGGGIVFVDLAPLSDPSAVVAEVAVSVGVEAPDGARSPGGMTMERTLADRLRDRLRHAQLLLVIDNCEHVIDAAARAVELALDAGPGVQVLATSREALRVDGEQLWPVPPLRVPDGGPVADGGRGGDGAVADGGHGDPGSAETDDRHDPVALLRYDAVQLFVQRARAADPSFELDANTAPAVAELCRRLDGLPLGIELAASRVATLPVTTLAARLGDRFRLLTGGRRTARRQETLAAVVAWSYDLLDDRQQWVFRQMGVFSGEVAVELVEAVLVADEAPAAELLRVLAELAERSLVILTERDDGPRVTMLETIRAFAHERLVATDDAAALRTRHAEVMADRAACAGAGIFGPDQLVWFRCLDDEIDEHRSAAAWAITADPVRAVRASSALAWFAWLRDRHEEAARWLERSLEAAGDAVPAADAAMAWSWLSFLRSFGNRQQDAETAAARARHHLDDAGEQAPSFTRAAVPVIDAYVQAFGADGPTTAVGLLEDAVALAGQLGEDWVVGAGRYALGVLVAATGERDRARHELDRALDAAGSSGDRWIEFQTRQQLALELAIDGDYAAAAQHLDLAIPLGEAIGAYGHVRTARVHRAVADVHAGELDRAQQQLEAIVAGGAGAAGAYSANMLGNVHRRRGEHDRALELARRAEASYLEVDELAGAVVACVELAHAALGLGDVGEARAAQDRAVGYLARVLPAMVLAPAIPFLLETDAAVILAEGGDAAPTDAALRLGRAVRLREDLGRPLVGSERFDVDRVEAAIVAALGADDARAAQAEGRDRKGLLPPLD